ncbi:MAG: hypothetical protein H0T73_21810 [Ardenticatenales bacterium]|nr:hypothetical protein [Ardenticatenales bacterium]
MKRLILLFVILLVLIPGAARAAPALQYQGEVSSPRPNAVLRGQVVINGTAGHSDFWKYEVRVTSGLNPNASDDQWFRITVQEQQIFGGQLAVWDTSNVPDGVYTLRLRVVQLDGNWRDFDVLPLSVANSVQPTPTEPPPPPPTEVPPTEAPVATVEVARTPTPIRTSTPSTPAGSPTPLASPTTFFVPTLTPSDAQALPTTAAGNNSTPTPILIDPLISSANTPVSESEEEGEGAEETGLVPTAVSDSDLPTLPVNLDEELNTDSLSGACIMGASFAAGIFLLIGVLYLLKTLVRLLR